MSRDVDSNIITAIGGAVVRPVTFVELHFDSPTGILYLHDGIGAISADDWDGNPQTWQGVGDLGGIEGIDEASDVSPYSATLILSGLDSTISGAILTDDAVLRDVYILISARNEDGSLVAEPHPMWRGQLNDLQVQVGSENVIRAVCESFLAAFERSNGILFNDADQQALFSGDVGFQYLEQVIDAKIVWGGQTQDYRTGGNVGGGGGLNFLTKEYDEIFGGGFD